jgi:hypothetical protein
MFMTGARQYDDIRLPQETNGCFVAIISERPTGRKWPKPGACSSLLRMISFVGRQALE